MSARKHQQFMELAEQSARIFSTCGKRQYAAILVNDQNHIVGFGYNGGPSRFPHCVDGGCPRLQEQSPSGSNYDNCISIHAEQNAFLNSDYSSEPTRLYVNGPPCFTCAKLIANSSVNNVYYISDPQYKQFARVQDYLSNAGINLVEIPPGVPNIKTIIR